MFYNKTIEYVYEKLNSKPTGLSESTVIKNREQFGNNELDKPKKVSFLKKFFLQFKNIMIIILLISAVISGINSVFSNSKENLFEAILILSIVIANAIVGVIQEQKAENALAALQESTKPIAKVIRNNIVQKIKSNELVVGDIVELETGDFVPADIRLISATNLKTNESSLTGESNPVLKSAKILTKTTATIQEQENICFSGTVVTAGHGTGIAIATGKNTEIGKISKVLASEIKEKTPLEKNIDKIGKALTFLVLGIVLIVFLVQIFTNKNGSIMDSFLIAVALAVAAIPESLPAVITIIMALGVQKLSKQNVIVKKLSAVETLGSCTVICTDKTGTLTKNQMSVSHIFSENKLFSETDFSTNLNPNLIKTIAVCNKAIIDENNNILSDATETALLKFLFKKNISVKEIQSENKVVAEQEFNSKTKTMTVVCECDGEKTIYQKGAIDKILPNCTKLILGGEEKPLSDAQKYKILNGNETLCKMGERVIAIAIKQNSSNLNDKLTFVGLVGIIDPPRKEAAAAIKECKSAGLKVVMITGDHPLTAFSVAKSVNLAKSKKEILTGEEINKLTDSDLSKIIDKYSIFARVTPEHKLKIVKALKSNGHIVAMTGDGVNDAPSIKAANIGACMGITGTAVTKEVADLIISDDNFVSITAAIKQGRTIYQNISKTILFLLSTNIVEVLGIFITSLAIPSAIFLLPVQILFINLVTDSLPAFALGIEPEDKNIMSQPPRNPKKSILSGFVGNSIIYQGFVQTAIVLLMFVFTRNYYSDAVATTMSFLTICFMQVIHAVNCKSEKSIFKINIFKNKFFNLSFIILIALILAVYFISPLSAIFSLTKLTLVQWLFVVLTSLSIVPIVELGKIFIK